MARVSVDKAWFVQGPGKGLDAALDRTIHEHGMTATFAAGRIEMRGGSQLKMRTMGGLFTKDSVLPRAGTLERSGEPDTPGVERITLYLEDKMGLGFMDPKMKQKYERILGGSPSASRRPSLATYRRSETRKNQMPTGPDP